MLKTLLISLLLIINSGLFGQNRKSNFNELESDSDIENLIQSIDKRYERFKITPIANHRSRYDQFDLSKRIADSLQIYKATYKEDFDKNGLTDILLTGTYYDYFYVLVAMQHENDSIKVHCLTPRSDKECSYPEIINDSIIKYHHLSYLGFGDRNPRTLENEKLIYKYNAFIEFNSQPEVYSIEKIEFQTGGCFGECPAFQIIINQDGSAEFKAELYNRLTPDTPEIEGVFNTTLKSESYSDIFGLLNYLDFPNLESKYSVNWTDDHGCELIIHYNGDQTKVIQDYGLKGSHGLIHLYEILFALRFNQNWK